MRDQEHSYEIYETEDGFKVVPIEEDRPEVVVTLDRKHGFWNVWDLNYINGDADPASYPLYSFYILLNKVVELLYESWKSPKFKKKTDAEISNLSEEETQKYYSAQSSFEHVLFWAKKQTRKCLAKKIRDIWKKKIFELDPEIETLHRKLFAVNCGKSYFNNVISILDDREKYKYLIKDALNYKGARIAILDIKLEYLDDNWMKFFGNPNNGSVRRTMMNPPNVPSYLLRSFEFCRRDADGILRYSYLDLPEPATTRIRFLAYATIAKNKREEWDTLSKVVRRSSDEDLKNAVKYMWEHFPNIDTGDFRKTSTVRGTFLQIFDYPFLIGDWDIMGLCKRSEQYHYDMQNQNQATKEKWMEENKKLVESKTAIPPIPLPENREIKFLDSYKSIIEESEKMKHCIHTYAKYAVKGLSYLFHVDYKGECASVEVNPDGWVAQSYGERNCKNEASKYGQKVLGQWAKKLQNANGKPTLDPYYQEHKFADMLEVQPF